MGKRIVITGANGFVGRNLSKFLVGEGHEVYALVRKNHESDSNNGVNFLVGDILNQGFLSTVLQDIKPDIVFHLAAQSRVGQSFTYPASSLETNIIGTVNLLEAVRRFAPACRVIFSSSAEVYGSDDKNAPLPNKFESKIHFFSEDQPVHPTTSPYSISKICGEYLIDCYDRSYGLDIVTVRSFNIEGPGREENFASSVICKQAADLHNDMSKGYNIGNLAVFRDYSHISDAVRAYCLVAFKGTTGSVYNLGSMLMTSLASFLLYATEAAGFPVHEVLFGNKIRLVDPLNMIKSEKGNNYAITKLDEFLFLHPEIVSPENGIITLKTVHGDITIRIDPTRFRPAENQVMVADNRKITALGYHQKYSVYHIASEQVQYFLKQCD